MRIASLQFASHRQPFFFSEAIEQKVPKLPRFRHLPGPQPALISQAKSGLILVNPMFSGGWTDTPPITYQMGTELPAVLSMAVRVNGKVGIHRNTAALKSRFIPASNPLPMLATCHL